MNPTNSTNPISPIILQSLIPVFYTHHLSLITGYASLLPDHSRLTIDGKAACPFFHTLAYFRCPVCSFQSDRPLRLCARSFFCSSPARLLHPVKATKCLFSRRGAGTLRKAKSFTLQGSFFPLRLCASARYIFYSSPAKIADPSQDYKSLFSRRGAEALRGTTRHYKCGISFSIIVPVFRCSLRPCASARECSCSFSSLVTA